MPNITTRVRRITDGIVLDLSNGDESNVLYLSLEEARFIAAILIMELRRHTVPSNDVVVLDAVLTASEARSLSIHLDTILAEVSRPHHNQYHRVNWQQEGF